jgi:hypothetical protein
MKNAITGRFAKRAPVPALLAAAIVLAATAQAPSAHAVDSDAVRIKQGLNIAPVPLNLKGLDKKPGRPRQLFCHLRAVQRLPHDAALREGRRSVRGR